MSSSYIALFRGLNVGGHGRVPMPELRAMLEAMGLNSVKTYVQSGNAVFRSTGRVDAASIERSFSKAFGFPSRVFVFDAKAWAGLIEANPYPQAAQDPKTLHLFVMDGKPDAAQLKSLGEKRAKLTGVQAEDEIEFAEGALYLHLPHGIGRSKLAELVARTLKVDMTGRNWRTVLALQEMAGAADG